MPHCIIAVHCGAGSHSQKNHIKYNKLSKKACRAGINLLKNGIGALEVIKEVISILENDALTNAGFGSSLTYNGEVEQDASIMDGKTLTYGGCGAVEKIKNPIQLAYDICIKQSLPQPLGLIPPSLLVGKGALQYARENGLKIVNNKSLISAKAASQHNKYKNLLDKIKKSEILLDTVGAVCIDSTGNVAAGCSSGGIPLKKSGRVGQAALYGCGAWADNFNSEKESSIAVCTSGCGEYLVRTNLAKEIAQDLMNTSCPTMGLSKSMTEKFLNSRYLIDVQEKLCGALVLHINQETKDAVILWGHSTETMSIGVMNSADDKPQAIISTLPKEIRVGTAVNVSGSYFYKNKQ